MVYQLIMIVLGSINWLFLLANNLFNDVGKIITEVRTTYLHLFLTSLLFLINTLFVYSVISDIHAI